MKQKISSMNSFIVLMISIMFFSSSLSAQTPILFTNSFDVLPTIAPTQTAGAWYPDRFPPAVFEKYSLNGENVLHVGVRLSDAFWNRPLVNHNAFSNTQGRKFDLNTGNKSGTSLVADVYVGSDWNTKHRMATLWSTACDSAGATSFYNIFGFRNVTGSDPGFYMYGYNNVGVYTLLPYAITYGKWYNLKIELTDSAFIYSINGTVVLSDTTLNGTKYFSNLMLQAYNFADSTLAVANQSFEEYDVYWDNVGANSTPAHYSNPAMVNLLSASNFKILAGSTVTIGSNTTVVGNVGVSPGTIVTYNGLGSLGIFHLNDASAIQAQADLTTAYNSAAGRTADTTVGSELGSTTLGRGVYVSAAGTFGITGTLTLTGSSNDIFIFKMATTLTTGAASKVILTGGALSSNVFWQVGSSATIGGDFKGNILALTAITQNIGASIHGSALARNSFVTVNGTSVLPVDAAGSSIPGVFELAQNYPNPFNPATTFSFSIPSKSHVSLIIFDAVGREVSVVLSQELLAGSYTQQWNAASLTSGMYFYRLQAGSFTDTKRFVLLK